MQPIVISWEDKLPMEVQAFIALFENGLEILHLRKPRLSDDEICKLIEKIPVQYHQRIVIHHRKNLLEKYKLRGVHISLKNVNDKISEHIQKSCSVHSIEEYLTIPEDFSYAFISPLFDSISKKGYKGTINKISEKGIPKSNVKAIALGGINDLNCTIPYNYGFDGIAMLGYIWNEFIKDKKIDNLINRYLKILNILVDYENRKKTS